MYRYRTSGTCSREIIIDEADGVVRSVRFEGGCSGNLQGLCKLVEGMRVEDVIEKLNGIQCRNGTSCPDQLSKALGKMNGKVHKA